MSDPSNVIRVEHDGREITLIGTAHVSRKSVEEVRRVITEQRPDTVCVELDETRYQAMLDPDRWRKLDIFQVIRQKRVLFLIANLALTSYQKKLGDKVGVKPGAELREAVDAARDVDAELVLADRDIQATLKRSFAGLRFGDKVRLVGELLGVGFGGGEEITEDQIEALKDQDTITELMKAFAAEMPGLQVPLIDERDRYLMSMIQEAPGRRIVAVVGAGHLEGMTRYLGQSVDRDALSVIPPPSRLTRALKWVLPVIVLSAFGWGYYRHAGEGLERMMYAWVLPNCIMAALLSALAGARPLTVLTAFVASPITSLNPTIGAGMVAGLVEAWLRKPTVEECERASEDVATLRGVYRNGFTRVLLVFVGATIGSALGAYIGAAWVVKLL